MYLDEFVICTDPIQNKCSRLLFVSYAEKNKDTMKRSTLLFAAIVLFAFASCTEDETIEEQVYIQDTIELKMSFSGEEGYDGTDDEKDQ